MKTRLFMFICFALSVMTLAAQECFTPTYNRGKQLYSSGQYKKALAAFQAARNCPDKPASNDLASWIRKTEQKLEPAVRKPSVDNNRVYKQSEVDKLPQFPGGRYVQETFIKGEMQYPQAAEENGQEGIVNVKVLVGKTGKLSNIGIAQSVYPQLDQEALRIVKKMPDWIPAEVKGRKVNAEYTIPIVFKLEKKEAPVVAETATKPEESAVTTRIESKDTEGAEFLKEEMPAVMREMEREEKRRKEERTVYHPEELKRHQFSVDLTTGYAWGDDFTDGARYNELIEGFMMGVAGRYQYNLSRVIGLNLNTKVNFGEVTAFGALVGMQFTTKGQRVSVYCRPTVGYGICGGESGFTYEVEVGLNIGKHWNLGCNNTGFPGDLLYCQSLSLAIGYRF